MCWCCVLMQRHFTKRLCAALPQESQVRCPRAKGCHHRGGRACDFWQSTGLDQGGPSPSPTASFPGSCDLICRRLQVPHFKVWSTISAAPSCWCCSELAVWSFLIKFHYHLSTCTRQAQKHLVAGSALPCVTVGVTDRLFLRPHQPSLFVSLEIHRSLGQRRDLSKDPLGEGPEWAEVNWVEVQQSIAEVVGEVEAAKPRAARNFAGSSVFSCFTGRWLPPGHLCGSRCFRNIFSCRLLQCGNKS